MLGRQLRAVWVRREPLNGPLAGMSGNANKTGPELPRMQMRQGDG